MKPMLNELNKPIGVLGIRVWHYISLLAVLWLIPLTFSDNFLASYSLYVGAILVSIYIFTNYLLRHVLRKSRIDVILIERYMVCMSFLVPTLLAIRHGLEQDFDGFTTISAIFCGVITTALIISIVIHLRNAKKFYKGVNKDSLFE